MPSLIRLLYITTQFNSWLEKEGEWNCIHYSGSAGEYGGREEVGEMVCEEDIPWGEGSVRDTGRSWEGREGG